MIHTGPQFRFFLLASLLLEPSVQGFTAIGIRPRKTVVSPSSPPFHNTARFKSTSRNEFDECDDYAAIVPDSRRSFVKKMGTMLGLNVLLFSVNNNEAAQAAPPIAVIAEELGYFPVTNAEKETVYVPRRIKRESSEQAVKLARKLRESGAVIYTAYWCPHCARQKELWGREAWKELRNVECAPKGYNAQPGICLSKQVDGYPTTILGNGNRISGERSLVDYAKEVGFKGFRDELETNLPAPLGSSACR